MAGPAAKSFNLASGKGEHALDEAILKVRIGSQPYMLDKISTGEVLDAYGEVWPRAGRCCRKEQR